MSKACGEKAIPSVLENLGLYPGAWSDSEPFRIKKVGSLDSSVAPFLTPLATKV